MSSPSFGIHVAKATVEKYMVRAKKPPSPTWRAFLRNHVKDLVSADFFVVPTVSFRVLFVFFVLAHSRRRVVHFAVTEHPTAQWTAQQVLEAFPWEAAPRYLLRDRDAVYGPAFKARVENMGIEEVLTAPRSPPRGRPRANSTPPRPYPANTPQLKAFVPDGNSASTGATRHDPSVRMIALPDSTTMCRMLAGSL